jgi:hypothetical protein
MRRARGLAGYLPEKKQGKKVAKKEGLGCGRAGII